MRMTGTSSIVSLGLMLALHLFVTLTRVRLKKSRRISRSTERCGC